MSQSEAEEYVKSIKFKVNDSNEYSELYGKLTWDGTSVTTAVKETYNPYSWFIPLYREVAAVKAACAYLTAPWLFFPEWTKNDLNLIFEERMVGSTKVFDVKFKNKIHG